MIYGGIMMEKKLNEQELEAICSVLADTTNGLTENELRRLMQESDIQVLDKGGGNYHYTYTIGQSKRVWLLNCFVSEINRSQSCNKVYIFIEKALNPVRYTKQQERDRYKLLLEETNKVLILAGLEVTKGGKLRQVVKATTLDEVDRRVSKLKVELYNRKIHHEVSKYCIKDYLRKDYSDAVFEAAKGLAERVREITGLKLDGGKLFQTAFSKNPPYLFFNSLQTENERSEFAGLKELLEAIFHLVRNPAAHTPKINWIVDENKALDVLTMISFAHKYLDECHKFPRKDS